MHPLKDVLDHNSNLITWPMGHKISSKFVHKVLSKPHYIYSGLALFTVKHALLKMLQIAVKTRWQNRCSISSNLLTRTNVRYDLNYGQTLLVMHRRINRPLGFHLALFWPTCCKNFIIITISVSDVVVIIPHSRANWLQILSIIIISSSSSSSS